MEVTCNTCGATFAATRSDARYCSPRCRTQAHRVKIAGDRPKRARPRLGDSFDRATYDANRAVARLVKLSDDDRVPRNRELLMGHANNARRMIGDLQNVVNKLNP